MKKNTLPDFTNKLVSVTLPGNDNGRPLDRPQWEIQGGRLFLVGKVPRGGSNRDWSEGIINAVAWDQVSDYLVFDSAKHYRERLATWKKRQKKG